MSAASDGARSPRSVRGLDATCTSDQASPLNTADHELYDLLHRLSTAGPLR